MLDFSEGSSYRNLDHRTIERSLPDSMGDWSDAMVSFIKLGAIRCHFANGYCGFNFELEPSKLKYLRMSTKDYVRSLLVVTYLPYYIHYALILMITTYVISGTVLEGLLLALVAICIKICGETFQLFIFEKTGVIIDRVFSLGLIIVVLIMLAGFGPLFFGIIIPIDAYLYHPLFIGGCIIVLLLGARYISISIL